MFLDECLSFPGGLHLLMSHGVTFSRNEMLAIKLHDGLYDESNKPYYIAFDKNARLRSNLPYILHQTDSIAAKIEYEQWLAGSTKPKINVSKDTTDPHKQELMNVFNDLFK